VIQPDGVDLDQSVWREVLNFRHRTERGAVAGELEAIRETNESALRDHLDVPSQIDDPAVEAAVTEAIGALLDDKREAAVEALAEVVRTPCEREPPGDHETEAGWTAACHRHDDRFAGPEGGRNPRSESD
jgi:peptide/nickel transport system ATP-binding protein